MRGKKQRQHVIAFTLSAALCIAGNAHGYQFPDSSRWTVTATDGLIFNPSQGKPTTVTWSIIPDGRGGSPTSRLVSFFDSLYPGGSGSDLTQRPWFFIFEESFGRFNELSGLNFVFEPNDDGLAPTLGNVGIVGVRGDIRFRAHPIDGQISPNIAARAFFPPNGDITLDSDNTDFYGNPEFESRGARNIFMHEIGHAIGMDHVESDDAFILMEPKITLDFDGPQLDDIRAIHRGYGDFYEKSNNGQGNDTAARATPLGNLAMNAPLRIGTDADDTVVLRGESDFVSIDDDSDIDFFSFTIDSASQVNLILTPRGPTYLQAQQGNPSQQVPVNSASQSDLSLVLLDRDGQTLLASSDLAGLGMTELISGVALDGPGTYFVRIGGQQNAVQLYELRVQIVPEPASAMGLVLGLSLLRRRC